MRLVYVCVQVFLRGVCRSVGRSRLSGGSHQRRSLELLHVRPPEHLRVTAATGRLALQTTALLRQQPWTRICKCFHLFLFCYSYIIHNDDDYRNNICVILQSDFIPDLFLHQWIPLKGHYVVFERKFKLLLLILRTILFINHSWCLFIQFIQSWKQREFVNLVYLGIKKKSVKIIFWLRCLPQNNKVHLKPIK